MQILHRFAGSIQLPEFALPYLRFGIVAIAFFLVARLLFDLTLKAAAGSAKLVAMPYQRGQFWMRRFRQQAEKLCATLAALITPPAAATLPPEPFRCWSIGWISPPVSVADLRVHLLGWPAFLVPDGRIAALPPAVSSA